MKQRVQTRNSIVPAFETIFSLMPWYSLAPISKLPLLHSISHKSTQLSLYLEQRLLECIVHVSDFICAKLENKSTSDMPSARSIFDHHMKLLACTIDAHGRQNGQRLLALQLDPMLSELTMLKPSTHLILRLANL